MSAAEKIQLTNGIHALERDEYDAIRDRINMSTLSEMERSPTHYLHRVRCGEEKEEDTDEKRLGRCVHMAVYEPDQYRSRVVTWTGKVRNGKKWDDFAEEHQGKEILTSAQSAKCFAIAESVRSSPEAASLLLGQHEVTALWDLEFPSVADFPARRFACKGRLDGIAPDSLPDLKTTDDASPEAFARTSFRFGYHIKAAWYSDGIERLTGRRLPFKLIAVESSPPHVVQVYEVPEYMIEMGREKYRSWLDRLDLCRRENRWPGYSDGPVELDLPPWERRKRESDLSDLDLVVG